MVWIYNGKPSETSTVGGIVNGAWASWSGLGGLGGLCYVIYWCVCVPSFGDSGGKAEKQISFVESLLTCH